MKFLYYSFLFACLYFYLGFGLTLLVCPQALRRYSLFLAPLIGYCYLTLVGWYAYNLDLGGTDVYAPVLLVPPFGFLCYVLLHRGRQTQVGELVNPGLLVPAVIAVLAFLVISVPAVLKADGPTSSSLYNNDITNYANIARYMKDFTRSSTEGFLGQNNLFRESVESNVFGAFLATAVPSSLFSLEPYQLQDISLRVFFLFSVLLCYAAAREVFQFTASAAGIAAALYGLNPILHYTINQGFEAQIIAMGLALFAILLHVRAVTDCQKLSDYYPYIPAGVLLNWGLSLTYPHILPFIYVPVAGYVCLSTLYARSRTTAVNWALFVLITLGLTVLLSPSRAQSFWVYLRYMGSVDAGWHLPLLFPVAFFGLTFENWALTPHDTWLQVALSAALIGLTLLGLAAAYRTDRKLFFIAISCLLPILAGYFLLARPREPAGAWGGYKSYKLLSFFLPLVLLGSLLSFRDLKVSPNTRSGYLLLFLSAVLFGCTAFSSYGSVSGMWQTGKVVRQDIADLKKVEDSPFIDSINIETTNVWDNMWYVHFLMRKKLYFKHAVYYGTSELVGDWTLKSLEEETVPDILHIRGFENGTVTAPTAGTGLEAIKTLPVSTSFVLERSRSIPLQAQFGSGWYAAEPTHRWSGGDSNNSSLILRAAERLTVDLSAQYAPLNPGNRLSIYVNGEKVAECPGRSSCQASGLPLTPGHNLVEFRAALPPSLPSNGDPRLLGYAFQSIDITPSRAAAAGR